MNVPPSLETIDEIAVSIADIRLSDLGLGGAAVSSALDPMASVNTHAGGGPAPDDVTRVIAIFEEKLDADRVSLDRRSEQVNLAMQLLDRETARYV
ncbi:MAG: hypothetical protein BA871_09250 [Desulfuromonadales bacterium C00003096]|nr:MAG: hypothetical protein BA871_09250 [Desulfuromonadales bacterium C00003096]